VIPQRAANTPWGLRSRAAAAAAAAGIARDHTREIYFVHGRIAHQSYYSYRYG
jgi:hypothetical protein